MIQQRGAQEKRMISFKKNKREEREECRYLELTFLSLLNDHQSETSAMIYSLVYYARNGVTFETSLKFVFSMRLSSQIVQIQDHFRRVYLRISILFLYKVINVINSLQIERNIVLIFFSIYTCIIRLNEAIKLDLKDFFIEGEE